MTATQVFLLFLKKKCSIEEYLFFKRIIMEDNGNRYFRKRKLYKNTFVEDYLSRNNRALNNFMTRLFILAPNLKNKCALNPRYREIKKTWKNEHEEKQYSKMIRYKFLDDNSGRVDTYSLTCRVKWNEYKGVGLYIQHYRRLWNEFLKEHIESDKKINSPFKKGESYDFKFKEKKSMIYIYNTHTEDHTNEEDGVNFYCGRTRDPKTGRNCNPLGNPFTHDGVKTSLAKLSFKTREDAIKAYGEYFDKAYGIDDGLTKAFDEIYEHYKNGENIYLQCFCKPKACHCDIIADRLQRKLIKEKIEERRKKLD